MSISTDPRVHARHYFKNLPQHAVAVSEPWWWAVLALGADIVNVHFRTELRGSLAIIARPQRGLAYNLDCEAVAGILKAEGKPSFDAYRANKSAAGKIVGLVTVIHCHDDVSAKGFWFSGPFGLEVEKPCLLPLPSAPSMYSGDGSILLPLNDERRDSIRYALTRLAAGADLAYSTR